jgi:hypothetical protein
VESTARTPNDVPHRKWRYDVLAVVARVVVETCRVLLDADRALVAMVCAAACCCYLTAIETLAVEPHERQQ